MNFAVVRKIVSAALLGLFWLTAAAGAGEAQQENKRKQRPPRRQQQRPPQRADARIPENLIRQMIADINTNINNYRLTAEDVKILRGHLKLKTPDLNGDGAPDFFLFIDHADWCGAGNICFNWVYRKNGDEYQLLARDKNLRATDELTNGFRNLISETPVGFCSADVHRLAVTHYQFDGTRYAAQEPIYECQPSVRVSRSFKPHRKNAGE